MGQKEDDH